MNRKPGRHSLIEHIATYGVRPSPETLGAREVLREFAEQVGKPLDRIPASEWRRFCETLLMSGYRQARNTAEQEHLYMRALAELKRRSAPLESGRAQGPAARSQRAAKRDAWIREKLRHILLAAGGLDTSVDVAAKRIFDAQDGEVNRKLALATVKRKVQELRGPLISKMRGSARDRS